MAKTPPERIRVLVDAPPLPGARFVLYWMTSARRPRRNFALQRAAELAEELGRPLVVLEALRCDYPHASDRFHRFVLDGMEANARAFAGTPVLHHAYVEPRPGAGRGLLGALAEEACAVVTDDGPGFFLPRMREAAARRIRVRMEAVDGNGLLPLSAVPRSFPTAFAFRRLLQRELPSRLADLPARDPLARRDLPRLRGIPAAVARRWPANPGIDLSSLPIDHSVGPAPARGGSEEAARALRAFVEERLPRYGEGRNHPDEDAASGLSPWLHFGHLSAHEVLAAVARREEWDPARVARTATGSREGWWGMSRSAEAFLDQLATWRELGHAALAHEPGGYGRYESLPPWARETLAGHAGDARPVLHSIEDLAAARTGDPVWNAAQTQLAREGRIHNYLRMIWGKRVLEWTPGPREALAVLLELNDRFALDGRDPNSWSGIAWCLGRYDRPWGPERPIFGTVRYMSTASTLRKLRMRRYLERFGPEPAGTGSPRKGGDARGPG